MLKVFSQKEEPPRPIIKTVDDSISLKQSARKHSRPTVKESSKTAKERRKRLR